MREFMIQDLCATCGVVEIPASRCKLYIYSDGTNRLTYKCPSCKLRVIHPLEEKHYLILFHRVTRHYSDPPREMLDSKRESLAILSETDVKDFTEALTVYPSERIISEAEGAEGSWA